MKKHVIFTVILLSCCSTVFSELDTLFFEDFLGDRPDWTRDSEENAYRVENGNYIWSRKRTGDWGTWWGVSGLNQDEFSIDTRFRTEGSGSFGIIWGSKDMENANNFIISSSGFASSYIESRGSRSTIREKIPVNFIQSGYNELKIEKKDNRVNYYVNGQKVHEDYFSGFFGENFGFSFHGISVYYMDYLLVRHRINLVPEIKYTESPENLGSNINTVSSEICPVVSPDGKGIYFLRVRDPENTGGPEDYSDIYFAGTGPDTRWLKAINMQKPLNNSAANSVNSVMPDGNTLFLLHTYNTVGSFKSGGLSISNRTGNTWEIPADVQVIDHYNLADYNEYCMSNDKKVIILAVQREQSYGEKDLYVSFQIEDHVYSVPLNLGPVVNSVKGEISPFLAADNATLYFSSNGHPGYGSNDIFLTRRLDDSWTHWSHPENLGRPINTNVWDAYYSVPASGEYAYFVSSKSGFGSSDIFRVKLPETARPNPVVLVKGRVLNRKTNEPLQAIINYFDLQNSTISGSAMSNPETGAYQITLPAGRLYGFLASSAKFISVSENIDLKELGKYKELEKDLFLVPIEIGEKVRLNNIFFETGKWDLLPESYTELDKLVKILNDNPNMIIEINGHTDNVGNDEANLTLSQKRAASVVTYILGKSIENTRLASAGFGENQPVAPNDTEEGRALNRRVEFVIVKM